MSQVTQLLTAIDAVDRNCTLDEVANILDLAPATVDRYWTCARAWLKQRISEKEDN